MVDGVCWNKLLALVPLGLDAYLRAVDNCNTDILTTAGATLA